MIIVIKLNLMEIFLFIEFLIIVPPKYKSMLNLCNIASFKNLFKDRTNTKLYDKNHFMRPGQCPSIY